jgi:hypothetical protein
MQAGPDASYSIEEDLEDLDETDRAIERAEKRLYAQEQRVALLRKEGVDDDSANTLLANMRSSVKELIMHRALVAHALARRQCRAGRATG